MKERYSFKGLRELFVSKAFLGNHPVQLLLRDRILFKDFSRDFFCLKFFKETYLFIGLF